MSYATMIPAIEVKAITAAIARNGRARAVFMLDDGTIKSMPHEGAHWMQTVIDPRENGPAPRHL